jgi:hypothetical protein
MSRATEGVEDVALEAELVDESRAVLIGGIIEGIGGFS